MKKECLYPVLLLFLILFPFTACCSVMDSDNSQLAEMASMMEDAEARLSSIDWNSESPGNIRAQLSAAEYEFSVVFDTLSNMDSTDQNEIREIYTMRTISCTYLELVSSMREFANVIEHRDNADYYAAYYEEGNWKTEMLASDAALASARNMLHSAKVRINGINMNLVPLSMQGDVVELKVRIDQLDNLMSDLAVEYASILNE